MKKIILFILIFVLNIVVVNAQLAKVFNEDNLDFDRAYRDKYLADYNHFSDIGYMKITGGYSFTMKVGNVNDNIKGINLNNGKKYAIHLLYCEINGGYCAFRVNGVPIAQMRKDSTFQIEDDYTIKIANIEFNYCGDKRFCNIGYEAYNIVNMIIDGPVTPICGDKLCDKEETCSSCTQDCGCSAGYSCQSNQCITEVVCGDGKCSSGESCSKDSCCNGKISDFKYDNENCGSCNNKCYSGAKCDNGICISAQINSDLSNYPDFLTEDGRDLILVVGDKSSSVNVVAQTSILSSLSSLGKSRSIKNKLASEITDLNQNIISFGNPCINEISAKIMGNPQPCDKDFQRGKGYIKLYKNNEFFYLIIAGYTDLGTRKAAEVLSNYKNYQFQGNEYSFQFSGDEEANVKTEEKKENITKIEVPKSADKPKENFDIKNKNEMNQKIVANENIKNITTGTTDSKQPQQPTEKTDNIVKKFISWFLYLFK